MAPPVLSPDEHRGAGRRVEEHGPVAVDESKGGLRVAVSGRQDDAVDVLARPLGVQGDQILGRLDGDLPGVERRTGKSCQRRVHL